MERVRQRHNSRANEISQLRGRGLTYRTGGEHERAGPPPCNATVKFHNLST